MKYPFLTRIVKESKKKFWISFKSLKIFMLCLFMFATQKKSWEKKVLDNEEFFLFSFYLKPWKLENNVCSCSEICRREKFMLKKSLVSFDSFSSSSPSNSSSFFKKKANFMHKLFILPHFFYVPFLIYIVLMDVKTRIPLSSLLLESERL